MKFQIKIFWKEKYSTYISDFPTEVPLAVDACFGSDKSTEFSLMRLIFL